MSLLEAIPGWMQSDSGNDFAMNNLATIVPVHADVQLGFVPGWKFQFAFDS